MKQFFIAVILIVFSTSSFSSKLKEFCDSDPTGELYSEIWDSSVEDGFESIGLKSSDYRALISKNPEASLSELARIAKNTHPEIATALKVWELETCITRGYEMLEGN
jgi:hypothetical protein